MKNKLRRLTENRWAVGFASGILWGNIFHGWIGLAICWTAVAFIALWIAWYPPDAPEPATPFSAWEAFDALQRGSMVEVYMGDDYVVGLFKLLNPDAAYITPLGQMGRWVKLSAVTKVLAVRA